MSISSNSNFPPLKIYLSYAGEDYNFRRLIAKVLSTYSGQFVILEDYNLEKGKEITSAESPSSVLRNQADVFLLLVSEAYLNSEIILSVELPDIMKKEGDGSAFVIPFILSSCDWKNSQFAAFQAIPEMGMTAYEYKSSEEPIQLVVERLEEIAGLKENAKAYNIIRQIKSEKKSVLDLSDCNLYSIPREILNIRWLTTVDLGSNKIKKIENLHTLVDLQKLVLVKNEITRIENLESLENLSFLDLEDNYIEKIENLDKNNNLHTLGLSANRIEKISGMLQLQKLRTLYVGHNGLKDISELERLPELTRIVLSNNMLTTLRPLLKQIRKGLKVELRYSYEPTEEGIFIKDNSTLSEPPLEEIAQGNERIQKYFQERIKFGHQNLSILKLILVGNSGVGKTNLSQFLRKRKMALKHKSTQLLDIQKWIPNFLISKESIQVNIFDFGGQDYYHDSHSLYYSHDTAYVLMWDKNSNCYSRQEDEKESKGKNQETSVYEDYPLEYWLESIRYNLVKKESFSDARNPGDQAPNINSEPQTPLQVEEERRNKRLSELSKTAPVLILQNKIDRGEENLNQVVLADEYKNIRRFFNVSLTNRKRTKVIEEVFEDYLNSFDLSGRQLLTYQYKIVQHYLNDNEYFMVQKLGEFRQECIKIIDDPSVDFDDEGAHVIARILNAIGIVFYDQPDPNTLDQGVIFTKISRLNELIKDVMRVAKQGNDKGLFRIDQLSEIDEREHILNLLSKNKSIIKISENEYLAPQFLPVDPEPSVDLFTQAFTVCQIQYVYTAYFHKSLLLSLFSKFVNQSTTTENAAVGIKKFPFWRNGLIVSKKYGENSVQMVFVKFTKSSEECKIEIRTMTSWASGNLQKEIEQELDELNKGWTHTKNISVNSEDFFTVKELVVQAAKGDFVFRKNDRTFTVNDFKSLVKFEKVPKKLFISYSSKNSEYIRRFITHLQVLKSAGHIEPWYDRMIEPGTKWDDAIKKEMGNSDIIIFLLSPDFLATEYIMKTEVPNAIELSKSMGSGLFFVELQRCGWQDTPIFVYQQSLIGDQMGKVVNVLNQSDNDGGWQEVMKILKQKMNI
jgi:internalin A